MCEHAYINTNPRAAGARMYPPLSVPTLSPGIDVTARLIEWDVSAVPELEGWIRDASEEMRLLLSQVLSCLWPTSVTYEKKKRPRLFLFFFLRLTIVIVNNQKIVIVNNKKYIVWHTQQKHTQQKKQRPNTIDLVS